MSKEYDIETDAIRAINRVLPIRIHVRLYESTYLHTTEGSTSTETTTRSLIRSWSLPVDEAMTADDLETHELTPVAEVEQEATDGAAMIAAERQRQVDAEGWTSEHDAEHRDDSLIRAAISYATPEKERGSKSVQRSAAASGRWSHVDQVDVPLLWPWAGVFWKPSPRDRTRELVKAGALIAAEIDRLAARTPDADPDTHRPLRPSHRIAAADIDGTPKPDTHERPGTEL